MGTSQFIWWADLTTIFMILDQSLLKVKEILSIEGRHLSSGETQMAKKGLIASDCRVEDMKKDHGGNLDNELSNIEGQKDYRPTMPGHSPGIGHAAVNRTTGPNV